MILFSIFCFFLNQLTGDVEWADTHAEGVKDTALSEIFGNPDNFDENGIKDIVIENLKLTCPNNCSGEDRGECVKSKDSLNDLYKN